MRHAGAGCGPSMSPGARGEGPPVLPWGPERLGSAEARPAAARSCPIGSGGTHARGQRTPPSRRSSARFARDPPSTRPQRRDRPRPPSEGDAAERGPRGHEDGRGRCRKRRDPPPPRVRRRDRRLDEGREHEQRPSPLLAKRRPAGDRRSARSARPPPPTPPGTGAQFLEGAARDGPTGLEHVDPVATSLDQLELVAPEQLRGGQGGPGARADEGASTAVGCGPAKDSSSTAGPVADERVPKLAPLLAVARERDGSVRSVFLTRPRGRSSAARRAGRTTGRAREASRDSRPGRSGASRDTGPALGAGSPAAVDRRARTRRPSR